MSPETDLRTCMKEIKKVELTDRVKDLKKIYFAAMPEICVERAKLVTLFSRERGLFEKDRISILDKARVYRSVLEKKKAVVRHDHGYQIKPEGGEPVKLDFKTLADPVPLQLFAGSTTQEFKGVPIYPEFQGLMIWPELETISKRAKNPYYLSRKNAEKLNQEIFPYWINDTILEIARQRAHLSGVENLTHPILQSEKEYVKLLELLQRLVFFLNTKPECISHTIPDFSKAIKNGLGEMKLEAQERQERKEENKANPSKEEFYASISEVLEGIIDYSHRLGKEAERLAEAEKDSVERKRELELIAEIHGRIPEKPARTFREALTTIWVCWTALHLENPNIGLSLGRLDQILIDFFLNDAKSKILNLESAAELLCCFWLKIGDHVPMVPQTAEDLFGAGGSNQAITIGGVNEDGKDAVNELTYLILHTIELMKLRDPNLNARYYPGINDKDDKEQTYLKTICEANIRTGATPAIHNDLAVIKALTRKKDDEKQARDYGIVGCVEPVSCGNAYGSCSSILLNLMSVLETVIFDGTHRRVGKGKELVTPKYLSPGKTFKSFEQFKEAFEKKIQWFAEKSTRLNDFFGRIHQDFYPTPILSAFFKGPMENGKDLSQGGAHINSSGVAIIGFADVVDSLSALETVVFDPVHPLPFPKFQEAMKWNFKRHEDKPLYRQLIDPQKTPKYGTDNSVANRNAAWLISTLDDAFAFHFDKNRLDSNHQDEEKLPPRTPRTNYRGGEYRVGYWTLTMHTGFAQLTDATPNGRKAGEAFASGLTPVSGVTPWVSEACNAVAKLPAKCIANGMAFNVKLSPEGDRMLNRLMILVDTFFTLGGMEIQFNIISHRDLERAMNHPEEYPELLVRVSGYTAYFKDLNREMQQEIISRTEFLLNPYVFRHFVIPTSPTKVHGQQPAKVYPAEQAQQDVSP